DSLFCGAYHSVFKGRGIEFSEVRQYCPGDDVRSIDWNVSARMNDIYIKEFTEERELNVVILFDVSASSNFGSGIDIKRNIAAEIIASVVFSAIKNNDRVALCLATNKIEKYIKFGKSRKHAMRILRDLLLFEPKENTTDLVPVIKSLFSILKQKSIIFVVSDFIGDLDKLKMPMRILGIKHDVVGIALNDERERVFEDYGIAVFEDYETGEQVTINTNDEVFRENYKKITNEHYDKLCDMFKKNKAGLILLDANKSWQTSLIKFFKARGKSRKWI
ncbi:MAG: DUF58 domain-containing protein, partial [Candidatus Aenigmarchaeota archaeon]|nr:DUF58 domain-containing protein [Candidatus Aenigmarchaeota archaeon]